MIMKPVSKTPGVNNAGSLGLQGEPLKSLAEPLAMSLGTSLAMPMGRPLSRPMGRPLIGALACAFTLALSACAGLPERSVPTDVSGALPDRYTDVLPSAEADIPPQWWKAFSDPQLIHLVEQGLQYNSDLIVAAQRLREAGAVMRGTRAGQLPSVGIFVQGVRQRAPLIGQAVAGQVVAGQADTAVVESGSYGVSIDYEVDLWGRLAAQTQAERQRYLAQSYTLAALRLTIAAELVRGYLHAQALQDSSAVLEENVQVLEDQLRLSERRYQIGTISELDLQRFRSELEDSRAQLAQVIQQQLATQRALLLLAGQLPTRQAVDALQVKRRGAAPSALPEVPTGLPSRLLDRRPDLRAAEAELAAGGADLSAARRAWLPSLAITGSAGEASTQLSSLFDDGLDIWSIGANLAHAAFDGGRRSAAIEASDARRMQLLEIYRNAARGAFREVADALDARLAATQVYRARSAQTAALNTALRLAQRRYDEGYSDYLGVLDARRSLLQSRLAVAEARRSGGTAYVDLVMAVGGGWDPESPPTTP